MSSTQKKKVRLKVKNLKSEARLSVDEGETMTAEEGRGAGFSVLSRLIDKDVLEGLRKRSWEGMMKGDGKGGAAVHHGHRAW